MIFIWFVPAYYSTFRDVVADFLDCVDKGHWLLDFVIVSVSPILKSDSDHTSARLVAEWVGAEFILYFH